MGGSWVPGEDGRVWQLCGACGGKDWDRNNRTDIRVFPSDLVSDETLARLAGEGRRDVWNDRLQARLFRSGNGEITARLPLVLAQEFFQVGLNFGVWRA